MRRRRCLRLDRLRPLRGSRDRSGFIILFGSRNIVGNDDVASVAGQCPRCGQQTTLVGKHYRSWFTLFFLPIFPMGRRQRFSQCTHCGAQFPVPLEELRSRLGQAEQHQSQQAIGLYNSLRSSPANSITLNDLMLMYASMKEFDQAASAANDFPEALNNSEQCMSTLGRVYLAMGRHADALRWFDAAIARNSALGEAHYHKAIAYLTGTPSDPQRAVAAARAARNAGYPRADELLREAEAKARGE
jgi:tetratricopeptide (TPR) repeat protein